MSPEPEDFFKSCKKTIDRRAQTSYDVAKPKQSGFVN